MSSYPGLAPALSEAQINYLIMIRRIKEKWILRRRNIIQKMITCETLISGIPLDNVGPTLIKKSLKSTAI